MSKEKEEVLDAEILEEITTPNFDDTLIFTGAKSKDPQGTRKKDFPAFTPENREQILDATSKGSPIQYAAKLAGVSPDTLARWLERGRHAQSRIEDGYEDELSGVEIDFANFFVEYGRVAARVVADVLGNVLKQSKKNPYIALKLLEKLDPNEFGPRQTVDMNVAGKVGVGHVHVDARQLADGGEIAKLRPTEELRLLRANLKKQKALTAGST